MIDCSDLLREYSDYTDGLMEPSRELLVEAHLNSCPSCARYADVVERGIGQLRSLPSLDPSPDFLPRLQSRLYTLEETDPWSSGNSSHASTGVVVLLVFLMAAAAWAPVLRYERSVVRL